MVDRPPLPDAAARERAGSAFDGNLVLLAGAGTGKTSLLVERLLCAIGSGHVRAVEVAASPLVGAGKQLLQRLRGGLPGMQPGKHETGQAVFPDRRRPARCSQTRGEVARNPDVRLLSAPRSGEALRRHAGDANGKRPRANHRVDYSRIGVEGAPPESIADDGDGL